jgi:hypothetical protein
MCNYYERFGEVTKTQQSFVLYHAKISQGEGDEEERRKIKIPPDKDRKSCERKPLKDDITKKLSLSKHRAISELSQPGVGRVETRHVTTGNKIQNNEAKGKTFPDAEAPKSRSPNRNIKKSGSSFKGKQRDKMRNPPYGSKVPTDTNATLYSSLLPPPIMESSSSINDDGEDPLSSGLSSWEEFLGAGSKTGKNANMNDRSNRTRREIPSSFSRSINPPFKLGNGLASSEQQRLPPIQDLFPPDLSSGSVGDLFPPNLQQRSSGSRDSSEKLNGKPTLDGVLPVSDLFYQSTPNLDEDDEEEHDDEELPFSAEQSDALSSNHNKIRIRRNLANKKQISNESEQSNKSSTMIGSFPFTLGSSKNSRVKGNRLVRRGMEMLVGGVPINADPPQRSLELFYKHPPHQNDAILGEYDWASVITLNARDFGPLLHVGSVDKVTGFEEGLFCEYFSHSAIKWDICPKDLRRIIKSHRPRPPAYPKEKTSFDGGNQQFLDEARLSSNLGRDASEQESRSSLANSSIQGFGKVLSQISSKPGEYSFEKEDFDDEDNEGEEFYETKGEFSFDIALTRDELESGEGGGDGQIFRSVIARAFMSVLQRAVDVASKDEPEEFVVEIPKLQLTEMDDGFTHVTVKFRVEAGFATSFADMERRVKRISAVFTEAIDDGDIALAIAAAAKEESRWPEAVRERVVEECLWQDDDGDEPSPDFILEKDFDGPKTVHDDAVHPGAEENGANLVEAREVKSHPDLYLGGGIEGAFFDYSAANYKNAPYEGEIGLRLVNAVTERAKQRQPRVIAIGDVHGCIDELQDLLRQCDYRPGDLVCFLGDLVCKGPDSISVVQMAREIGAIGVRGNHDFEVVRWHQAIKSGVDHPVVGSEHFHIASCLSKADMKWMYSLPWYISSKDLSTLFVHAGFVSGVRLAKQNPRLMMNMRSILPDGTVTSKFFNNWPWARLWDGPQTVLFGHDADRGLQQYEHAIGLDTGCVYGGRLTACILPEKKLVSVSARREYFKYRRKHYD